MRLLDAHRRQKKAEAEAQAYLEQQDLRRQRRAQVADYIAALLAVPRVATTGWIEGQQVQVVRTTVQRGPLGGESDRLHVYIGDDLFIVNVYASGVMAPEPEK